MRLSDFKGEEAIDVLADIIDPISKILTDAEIQELSKKKDVSVVSYIKPMLKNNKKETIEILARLDNKSVEEYTKTLNLLTLPAQVMDLINDPELQKLFLSQEQSESNASSTPATETTEAGKN